MVVIFKKNACAKKCLIFGALIRIIYLTFSEKMKDPQTSIRLKFLENFYFGP